MPWSVVNPSQEQIDHWSFSAQPGLHKVSFWPHPHSARINCFFRIQHTFPEFIPIAGRYGFYYHEEFVAWDPDVPSLNQFGAFDAVGLSKNHVRISLGANAEGFTVTIDIEAVDVTPIEQLEGVVCTVVTTHAVFGTQTAVGEYSAIATRQNWFHNQNTNEEAPAGGWQYTNDPAWTIPRLEPVLFGVSDCYPFELLPAGFAAFNGTDSYIELTQLVDAMNVPFVVEAEVRLHDVTTFWPIFGREGQGGFFGMDGDDIIFGNLRLDTTWTPVLDTWFTWKYEFEQSGQLSHKLTIDDVVVRDSTNARQFARFDRLGVYRHGVSGTIWGNFDLKNLRILHGTAPSSDVTLDMPLFENALDLSVSENHGTTFNMPLPSV